MRFAPVNLYMSVLNWLIHERVAEKGKANHAYPIGGEYVVDVDYYLNYSLTHIILLKKASAKDA